MFQKRFYRQAQDSKRSLTRYFTTWRDRSPPSPRPANEIRHLMGTGCSVTLRASLCYPFCLLRPYLCVSPGISPSTLRLLSTPSPEGDSIASATTRVFDPVHGFDACCITEKMEKMVMTFPLLLWGWPYLPSFSTGNPTEAFLLHW